MLTHSSFSSNESLSSGSSTIVRRDLSQFTFFSVVVQIRDLTVHMIERFFLLVYSLWDQYLLFITFPIRLSGKQPSWDFYSIGE